MVCRVLHVETADSEIKSKRGGMGEKGGVCCDVQDRRRSVAKKEKKRKGEEEVLLH